MCLSPLSYLQVARGANVCPRALPLRSLKLSLPARQLPLDSLSVEQEDPALKEKGSWRPVRGHSGTSGEAQVDWRSIAPRVNRIVATTVTGSSPRLANQYLGGFLHLFPKLWLLLDKVNDGTSSGYRRLPSALTKCLLQVRVWLFSGMFVRLMTRTQRFSSLLFCIGSAKSAKWRSLLDVLEQSGKQQHWNILQQHALFNVLPPGPKFLLSWSIIMHKSHSHSPNRFRCRRDKSSFAPHLHLWMRIDAHYFC